MRGDGHRGTIMLVGHWVGHRSGPLGGSGRGGSGNETSKG